MVISGHASDGGNMGTALGAPVDAGEAQGQEPKITLRMSSSGPWVNTFFCDR